MIRIEEAIPDAWAASLGGGPIGIGYDIATTEKATSNPSAMVVTERISNMYVERLVVRWKTQDDALAMAVLERVIGQIMGREFRPRRLCVDASNETYFAAAVARNFAGRVPVEPVKGGQNVEWKGQTYQAKILLGNLYVSAHEDNLVASPPCEWIFDDRRLVIRDRGSFVANISEDGGHADTFDAGKLALYALETGTGMVEATAVRVGGFQSPAPSRDVGMLRGRLARWRRADGAESADAKLFS